MPGVVGGYAEAAGPIRKNAAGAAIRQGERNQHSGNRLVVLVIHLDHGFPRHALADVIDGPFSLEDRNAQCRRLLVLGL